MQQKGELEKAERENSRLTDALKNTKASISKQKQSQWYENNCKFCENISKYKKNKYIEVIISIDSDDNNSISIISFVGTWVRIFKIFGWKE